MANKTKLPQTNTNQNVFTLDDGTKEITLVNPYGKIICKLHIRPGDVSIYDRYKALMDDFDSIIKPLSDMDIKNDGTSEFDDNWEKLQQVETVVKQRCSTWMTQTRCLQLVILFRPSMAFSTSRTC